MGKSVANQILISDLIRRKKVDLVLTIDDKTNRRCYYPDGVQVPTIGAYINDMPPASKNRHVVFRGSAYRRDLNDIVTPGEVAQLAWDVVRVGEVQVLVNLDELANATPKQGQAWLKESATVASIFHKGRGAGVSITWTTQIPQFIPLAAFALSETMGIFRVDAREVDYLYSKRVISEQLLDVIPALDIGEWILYQKGRGGWDGHIYKFQLPQKKEE